MRTQGVRKTMSKEHLHSSPEHQVQAHNLEHEARGNLERLQKAAEQAESEPRNVEHLKDKVEHHAISAKEITVGERQESASQQSPLGTQHELKADAYERTLQKVRKDLNAPEKTLSRIIHQPVIESLSNVGGKTVARPSGILGGGIVGILGSSAVLYMAKHYGFQYNFFVFFLLFVGGFGLGILAEVLLRLLMPHRHKL